MPDCSKRELRIASESRADKLDRLRLQRVRDGGMRGGLPEQVEDILQSMDALPNLDERAEDEILGY
jgi:hypothetical protein